MDINNYTNLKLEKNEIGELEDLDPNQFKNRVYSTS